MTKEQLRKAWANVESLAETSDYCNHDKDSQDLKDIELIGKLVDEKIREIKKEKGMSNIDYNEKKTVHVDYIDGRYGEWEYVPNERVWGFPITITRNQYELMKLCKFNANRTNDRNFNEGIAKAFIEAMENMFNVIEEEVERRNK